MSINLELPPAKTDSAPAPATQFADQVRNTVAKTVVGQNVVVERVLIALLTGGHLLLEGMPGLAKTLLVNAVAKAVDLKFGRVQFTIDLLPSDVTGTEIIDTKTGQFRAHLGPIFTNLLLADEINRAAPRVQSSLLEAMQERRVTIGNSSMPLPMPFLVIATQNPIDQAGTFELPEAQLDRFMMCHRLSYPTAADENTILRNTLALGLKREGEKVMPRTLFDSIANDNPATAKDFQQAMSDVQRVYVSDVFLKHVVDLVQQTRKDSRLAFGASPRGGIALTQAARARAYLHNREYVIPQDLIALAEDVLRHRMRLTYAAAAEGLSVSTILAEMLSAL